jgi:hypothetical protein
MAIVLLSLGSPPPGQSQVFSSAEFFVPPLNPVAPLGTSVALTDTHILAARPFASPRGEVAVLDARTGVQRRILRSPLAAGGSDSFGYAMAAGSNLALIGAPSSGGRGAAYLMNPSTGALIRFLQPIAVNPGDNFGFSVAMTGSFLVVGAPTTTDAAGVAQGAVYVFETRTGTLLRRLLAPDAAAGDRFGLSVAVSGQYVVVGAPFKDAVAGRVYAFNALTGSAFTIPAPAGLLANDGYGASVAVSGSLLIAGAPGGAGANGRMVVTDIETATILVSEPGAGNYGEKVAAHGRFFAVSSPAATLSRVGQGTVTVFESTYPTGLAPEFRKVAQCFHSSPLIVGESLGSSIALNDDTLVAGIPFRTNLGSGVGSVMRFGPFASRLSENVSPLGHHEAARRGQTTPDRAGTVFNGFTQLAMAPTSTLGSPRLTLDAALNGGRSAWCSNTNLDGGLFTLGRTGDPFTAGVNVIDFLNPIANGPERSLVRAVLRGTAVTPSTNEAILLSIQRAPSIMVRKGATVGGGQLTRLGQPRMGTTGLTIFNAKINAAPAADSGLFTFTDGGTFAGNRNEGTAAPGLGGILLGEIANRSAIQSLYAAYAAGLQTAPSQNQAVFKDGVLLAQRGAPAPGTGFGQVFSSFIGESINDYALGTGETVFRATLSGPGVTVANNEGLWSDRNIGGVVSLVVRKGDQISGLPIGVVLHRFLNFSISTSGHVFVHAQLRGPGITAANDGALLGYGLLGNFWIVLREGDAAPGCGGARFATFNLVHPTGTGFFSLLATLTDSTPANNLALFFGRNQTDTGGLGTEVAHAQPRLLARKGHRFERTGSSLVKSIAQPGYLTDGSGAGASGLAQVTGPNGNTAAILTFTDNETAAVVLKR